MEIIIQLAMDVIVLIALGVTIFYAVRLSNSLNAFKQNKAEFEETVRSLSGHINNAYDAIESLKNSSNQMADDLQEGISDAKYMLEELRQVNEVSDSLAHRLEVLAQKGRQSHIPVPSDAAEDEAGLEEQSKPAEPPVAKAPQSEAAAEKPKVRSWKNALSMKMKEKEAAPSSSADSFFIRDREFENENTPMSEEAGWDSADMDTNEFASQAEKDLYEVLKARKR